MNKSAAQLLESYSLYTQYIVYDGSNNPIYICEAIPGSSKTAALWRIKKVTYDINNNPTDVKWADGNADLDNVANNYETYNYS